MGVLSENATWGRPTFNDPTMEPALKVIREHRDVAKNEIERLQADIDARHAEMKRLGELQDADVKKLKEFQVELRAHERLLTSITVPRAY